MLDLRSNPGGLLTSAVQIADDLLESGKIVSTRGRIADQRCRSSAPRPGDLHAGAPVVVLVDAGSASASEVLAGALARQRPRARGRQPHLRQGLGADAAAARQRRLGQAHHRALLHAQRQVDPGARHRAGRGAEAGQGRADAAPAPRPTPKRPCPATCAAMRKAGRRQRRRRARRRRADHGGAGGTEEAGRDRAGEGQYARLSKQRSLSPSSSQRTLGSILILIAFSSGSTGAATASGRQR